MGSGAGWDGQKGQAPREVPLLVSHQRSARGGPALGPLGPPSFTAPVPGLASTLPRLTPPPCPRPHGLSTLLSPPLPPHVVCRKRDSILGVWGTGWSLQYGGDSKWDLATEGTEVRVKDYPGRPGNLPGVMQHRAGSSTEWETSQESRSTGWGQGRRVWKPQVAPEKGMRGVWTHVVTPRAGG